MPWGKLVWLVFSALISQALAPKPPDAKAAALGDIDIPGAEEGKPVPVVFGTVWVGDPNVIWYGDLSTTPIKAKGGKK